MPQTMLALLGLMLVAQFTLAQFRDVLHSQLMMIETEARTIGASIAVEHLGRVAAMPFDDATKGGNTLETPSALTAPASFRADAPSDDVDDFDGSSRVAPRPAGSDTLWFDVRTDVSYADELNPNMIASSPTKLKRIVATVSTRNVALADTIRLERLVSCGSACSW